jgi:hypothetical protein
VKSTVARRIRALRAAVLAVTRCLLFALRAVLDERVRPSALRRSGARSAGGAPLPL